jgi:hypothetical protein
LWKVLKEALREQHDDREDQPCLDVHECADHHAQNSQQHDRHDGARPDDVHVLAIEEKNVHAGI